MRSKKILSWTLALALSFSLAAPALAADTSFSDVQPGAWYYDYVTQCVSRGLMSGMGNGTFSPDSQMTVGQFITVAINITYPDEGASAKAADTSGKWWNAYYTVALNHNVVTASDYAGTDAVMNTPITRQEMAKIASRVMSLNGEMMYQPYSSIVPDYSSIGTGYGRYVLDAYGKGVLTGIDDKGTFDPLGVLTRAQACSVVLRLVDESQRIPPSSVTNPAPVETHEYHEGELRTYFPEVGDVVIKADGTRVTLEQGPGGILGACQGVDIYSGIMINGNEIKIGGIYGILNDFYKRHGMLGDLTPLKKDPITGEVHTGDEWNRIKNSDLNPIDKYVGDYDGEIFNTWYQWDGLTNTWIWIGPRN